MRKCFALLFLGVLLLNFSYAETGEIDSINQKIQEIKDNISELNDKYDSLGAQGETPEIKTQLDEINSKYKELDSKYGLYFSGGLDVYNKIIIEKSNAYDIALNQIKYRFWIIGCFFSTILIILGFLGYKSFPDIKKSIIEQIQSNIVVDQEDKINNAIEKNNIYVNSSIELEISKLNEYLNYSKIKDLKDNIVDELNPQINTKIENIATEKIKDEVRKILLPDNQ